MFEQFLAGRFRKRALTRNLDNLVWYAFLELGKTKKHSAAVKVRGEGLDEEWVGVKVRANMSK
jgi:hypothetical protein